MDMIALRDATSGAVARLLPGWGFNCFDFQVQCGGRAVPVLWAEEGFEREEADGGRDLGEEVNAAGVVGVFDVRTGTIHQRGVGCLTARRLVRSGLTGHPEKPIYFRNSNFLAGTVGQNDDELLNLCLLA